MRQAAHMGPRWFMAQDQRIGLPPVDQRHCHTRIGYVIQTALTFDVIPMVFIIVRCQIFNCARHKIGDDGIQRNAFARNQNACLTCGAEI